MSGDDRDVAADAGREEHRVGDVLRSSSPEAVDPELVASLHSWFDGPALALDELLGHEPENEPENETAKEGPVGRGKVTMDDIDPLLHDKVWSWNQAVDEMLLWCEKAPALCVERRMHSVEPPTPAAMEIREVQPPWYLEQALSECTPQSLLRDLARVEMSIDRIFMDEHPLPTRGLGETQREQRALMGASYKQLTTPRLWGADWIEESQTELRELLSAPWGDSRPANPRKEMSWTDYALLEAKLMRGEL